MSGHPGTPRGAAKEDAYRIYPTQKQETLAQQQKINKLSDWVWSPKWQEVEKYKGQLFLLQDLLNKCSGSFSPPAHASHAYDGQPSALVSKAAVHNFFSNAKGRWIHHTGFFTGDYNSLPTEYVGSPLYNVDGNDDGGPYDVYFPADNMLWHSPESPDAIISPELDRARLTGLNFRVFKKELEARVSTISSKLDKASAQLAPEIALFKKLAGASANKYIFGTAGLPFSSFSGNGGGTTQPPGNFISKAEMDAKPVIYNVGSVKEGYLPTRATAHTTVEEADLAVNGIPGNTWSNSPSAVWDAKQLWREVQGSKGMFQTYFPPGGSTDYNNNVSAFPKNETQKKYGFQFLYNPGSINMNYMGVAQTDVALQMSGKDPANYIPPNVASASISFKLLLNRMYDMKYYNTDGTLKSEALAANLYAPRNPWNLAQAKANGIEFDEQNAIYNKGTMYDVEYLLRVLLGYTLKSQLRYELTADMGFFSRRKVELHLGPSLRYYGYVNSLAVNHVMFNERMVPILSYVDVGFSRYPDYPDSNTWSTTYMPIGNRAGASGSKGLVLE